MTDRRTRSTGRALTVDLWHTLAYLEPEEEERYMREQVDLAASLLRRAPPGSGSPPEPDPRRTFEAVYAEAVAASQQGRSVTPSAQIEEAARRLGRSVDPAEYLDGMAGLVATMAFRPAPGALAALRSVRESGWACAVISNTVGEPGETLRPVLHQMGYDDVVDAYVFSDEQRWTKPAPEIFAEALRQVGAQAARSVHVGDGWVDIEGARRAGYRAAVLFTGLQRYGERYRRLFLPDGWEAPETSYRIGSWAELLPLLERLR